MNYMICERFGGWSMSTDNEAHLKKIHLIRNKNAFDMIYNDV